MITKQIRKSLQSKIQQFQIILTCSPKPAPQDNINQQQSAQNYQLQSLIATGEYGQVLDGSNIKSNEAVAIKNIKLQNLSLGQVKILNNEIVEKYKLSQRNIVQIQDQYFCDVKNNQQYEYFIVMEKATMNLNQYIIDQHKYILNQTYEQQTKLNTDYQLSNNVEILTVFCQISHGLQFLHQNNIIHGNLKPQNILVFKYGDNLTFKISDFTALLFLSAKAAKLQHINYQSPELISKIQTFTTAADVWSLGCIFYEICTGCQTFPGNNPQNAIKQCMFNASLVAHKETKELISKMLLLDHSKRILAQYVCNQFKEIKGKLEDNIRLSVISNLMSTKKNEEDEAAKIVENQCYKKPESYEQGIQLVEFIKLTRQLQKANLCDSKERIEIVMKGTSLKFSDDNEWNIDFILTLECAIVKGKCSGVGKIFYKDKFKYIGEFMNNKHHGFGTYYRDTDQIEYQGFWDDGSAHGQGELAYYTQNKYVGIWKAQYGRLGQGQYIFANGAKIEGIFDKSYCKSGTITLKDLKTNYIGEIKILNNSTGQCTVKLNNNEVKIFDGVAVK